MDDLRLMPLYDRSRMTHLRISGKGKYECEVRFSCSGRAVHIVEKFHNERICIVTEFTLIESTRVSSVIIYSFGAYDYNVDFRFIPRIKLALSNQDKVSHNTCPELLELYLITLAVQHPVTTSSINYILRIIND